MSGKRLLEYDCGLSDYVVGNVRQYLRGSFERPSPKELAHPSQWEQLDFPSSFATWFQGDTSGLADYVWSGVFDEHPQLPLNDVEWDSLESFGLSLPMRLSKVCVWEPYDALHRRHIDCIPAIREGLTSQTAEEWAVASTRFAARLSENQLPLVEGIVIVREWVDLLRSYLRVFGDQHLLPAPISTHATPTIPFPCSFLAATVKAPHAPLSTTLPRNREDQPHPDLTAAIKGVEIWFPGKASTHSEKQLHKAPAINPGPDHTGEFMTPAQVATKYALSLSTVYGACRTGLLTHYRVPSVTGAKGKYLIKEVDVLAWFETLKIADRAPTPPSACAPASSGSPVLPFSELNPQRLAKAWKKS